MDTKVKVKAVYTKVKVKVVCTKVKVKAVFTKVKIIAVRTKVKVNPVDKLSKVKHFSAFCRTEVVQRSAFRITRNYKENFFFCFLDSSITL